MVNQWLNQKYQGKIFKITIFNLKYFELRIKNDTHNIKSL